jgi:hypothetical protein
LSLSLQRRRAVSDPSTCLQRSAGTPERRHASVELNVAHDATLFTHTFPI